MKKHLSKLLVAALLIASLGFAAWSQYTAVKRYKSSVEYYVSSVYTLEQRMALYADLKESYGEEFALRVCFNR